MKILLAESDPNLKEVLLMLLKSFKYDVISSSGADDTLCAIRDTLPDLILVDENLKDKDGLEVSKMIKEDFLTAYIPIILLIDRKQVRSDLLRIEQGIDDYIIKPPDPIDLHIRIEMAVRRAAHQFFANALTKLPGNRTIELAIRKIIQSEKQFSFGYIDIDRFKYFNDSYGYLKGDSVIIHTSQIISRVVKAYGNKGDFVGHIGGDDFVFITNPEKERDIASQIISEFDRLIPYHYSKEDRERGYIQVQDRQGKLCKMQLMNISIALVNNVNIKINSILQLSEIAFEIKRHLKTLPESKFLSNRRRSGDGEFYRQPEDEVKKGIQDKGGNTAASNTKKPLGQLLLESNFINEEKLDEALIKHWRTGQSLGRVVIGMGLATEENISNILRFQGK